MAAPQALLTFTFTVLALALAARAYDPSPLQDFCVADYNSTVFVNGKVCKDPSLVTPDDFVLSGLDKPGNTSNPLGLSVNLISDAILPGLNTLGMAIGRIDFAPFGLNPPHSHPRGSEILTVIEGTLYAGFVTSGDRLYAKLLKRGDAIVFPIGLMHFQYNVGKVPAVALANFNSQNPGRYTFADALFGSNPRIPVDVLKKAFQVDGKVIKELRAQYS